LLIVLYLKIIYHKYYKPENVYVTTYINVKNELQNIYFYFHSPQ
jgi:hypothetical protein